MQENFESHKKELLKKYLNNACTRAELKQLFEYLQQSGTRQAYEEVLKDIWYRLSAEQAMHTTKADDIFAEIVSQPKILSENTPTARRVWWANSWQWRKIAAVFIGLLIVAGVAYQFTKKPEVISYNTTYGEIKEFWLPDSSRVILNGNSSLSYKSDWDEATGKTAVREVWLEGEGYFEVQEMLQNDEPTKRQTAEKLKFIVHTSHLNVEVLGTTFNVHNHKDKTQVVLSSGKVKLDLLQKNDTDNLFMNPGDLVEFNTRQQVVEQKIVNPALYSSWKDQQLMFEDTPVSEIIQVLQDRYGFDINLEDKNIGSRKFTGKVSTHKIDLLIKAMASSFGLKVSQQGKKIIMQYQ